MAISKAQETGILKIVAGLFNAAPGGKNLTILATLVENGVTLSQLADVLAATDIFQQDIMGGKVTVEEQVDVLMNNFGLTSRIVRSARLRKLRLILLPKLTRVSVLVPLFTKQ